MALDDHKVCLKAALAATLVVFLTLEKRRQARTLTEWALILEVLKVNVYSKRARMAMIPESSVLGDSTHDRISPDGLI